MRAVQIDRAQVFRLNSHPLIKQGVPAVAFQADKLKVYIYPTRQIMGQAAALVFEQMVRARIAESEKHTFCPIFAAAPSQNDVIESLVASETFPWVLARALLHMDEYLKLPPSDERSFRWYLNTHLWGPLLSNGRAINPALIHQIQGEAPQATAEARRYARLINIFEPDMVQGGVGEVNAHLAFNDPPAADFNDPDLVKIIQLALAAKRQQVAEGHFPNIEDIPAAFTLTIPALTRGIFYWSCVVPTERKATAVEKMVFGPITGEVLGTILRTDKVKNTALFLDPAAAHLLEKPLFDNLGIDFNSLKPRSRTRTK